MTTTFRRACAAVLLAGAAASPAGAQQSAADELALFQLDALLAKETSIASRRAKSLRESPGVVTIVTRQEIRESGARDLWDVLMAVPGFQIGGEVQNTTGVGFRGMTASEGKVLVLVDGVILNDLLYGGAQLDSYPIDDVERVEVIRGPGSAMYGGFAELAVVNVVTRSDPGLSATATWGQMDRIPGRQALSVAYGRAGDGWSARVAASGGATIRGDGTYVDGTGASFAMADASALDDVAVNAGATVRGLSIRVLHDQWRNETREGYGDVMPDSYRQSFKTTSANARYELALAPAFRISPELGFLRSTSWQANHPAMEYVFDKTADRYTGRVIAAWDPSGSVGLTFGVEAFTEVARLNDDSELNSRFADGKTTFDAHNLAAWAEGAWDAPFANLLVGGRFEHHDRFGDSFVPRLALTKLFDPFHVKVLYAHAFRAPAVENVTSNPDLTPERTRSAEVEVGWRVRPRTWVAVNGFYVRVEDAIVYTVDASSGTEGTELYRNYARTGAHGAELDVRHEAGWGGASLAYSFYTTAEGNQVDLYAVPGRDDRMLGFAVHKVTGRATVRLGRSVTVAPTLTFLSDRYGYTGYDSAGELVLGRVGPKLTADVFLTWRDAFARGLELSAGVHDLLDTGAVYVTPYRPLSAVHGFLPGPSREFMVRVGWGG